jgi:hypothetical protein
MGRERSYLYLYPGRSMKMNFHSVEWHQRLVVDYAVLRREYQRKRKQAQ